MFYRAPKGITASEGDMCRNCRDFEGGNTVCVRPLGLLLNEPLEEGMQLEVLYCPYYAPPLGNEAKR